ncbi:hypothetical protein A8709_25040 [Paenibacillus pectinilyticus]|uniref:Uncharacterized protein n=1 Tax=Paenibacillus pectinilyticus TaxID=512399 RepID=A0A1C1A2A7_9BACL|nr:hypothetical protein [Paenibacillus pectinilyticus]OCT14651.1 hypothetical protein A8709_25040 [Paenibacillus pectinilyticus]
MACAKIKAVRQPDLVLITWTRNPLVAGSPRRITSFRVIGSAQPCRATLVTNGLLITALNCLLDDFKIVYQKKTTSISGYLLLQRFRVQ